MTIQTQMNLGRVRPVYKGAYNALLNYGTLDMVLYEKEIWMMVARSYTPGDLPVDSGNGMSASGAWAKIGYQGEQGVQGLTGPIGPYYTPSVAVDGTISWMNNGGLVNPSSVKLDLYWHQISGTCTQVSTTQFTVAGTEAAIVEGRGVRINDSLLAHISAVVVENDVTTVTVDSAVVPATILKVEVGVISIDMLPTITGFLPLSGGTLTGILRTKDIYVDNAAIRANTDTQSTMLYGGVGWAHGAQGVFYGKDDANLPGSFTFRADNGTISKTLVGSPDGTLTWNGVSIVNKGDFNKMFFSQTSGSYTAPYTGVFRITLKGGGGGGGYYGGGSSAGGGGEGGMLVFYETLTKNTSYQYTIGAGGSGGVASTSTSPTGGGNSTFNNGAYSVDGGAVGYINGGTSGGAGGRNFVVPSGKTAYFVPGAPGGWGTPGGTQSPNGGGQGAGFRVTASGNGHRTGAYGGGGQGGGSSQYPNGGAGGAGFILIEYAE